MASSEDDRTSEEDEEDLPENYQDRKQMILRRTWEHFESLSNDSKDFFSSILIARDGGFSEVGDLWYSTRYFMAAVFCALVVSNMTTIICNDSEYLFSASKRVPGKVHPMTNTTTFTDADNWTAQIQDDFMVTGYVIDFVVDETAEILGLKTRFHSARVAVTAGVELFLLSLLLIRATIQGVTALCTKDEQMKWTLAGKFFWKVIPEISTFSSMRLLHFASPSIIAQDAAKFVAYSKTRWRKGGQGVFSCLLLRKWTKLIASRALCFVLGVDSFLFKVRVAYIYIHRKEIDPWGLLTVMMFIIQILGIVQLAMFVRGRIFLFIFGGEDAVMQPEERALQTVWESMLVREIFQKHSRLRSIAILLSFGDTDFQSLVLNEATIKTRQKSPSSSLQNTSEPLDNTSDDEENAPGYFITLDATR